MVLPLPGAKILLDAMAVIDEVKRHGVVSKTDHGQTVHLRIGDVERRLLPPVLASRKLRARSPQCSGPFAPE